MAPCRRSGAGPYTQVVMQGAGAPAVWARTDLGRRWRSLVVLGVLVGITSGFALAALAGARRTATALPRLRTATAAADAVVFPSQVGAYHPDWRALAARPEVARVAVWDLLFGYVDGHPGLLFGSDDGTFQGTVDRPVVVAGRMFDPRAADEIVVDEHAARDMPLGSTFGFQAFAPGESDESGAPPTGPRMTLRVVGVVREVAEHLFVADGQAFVSPGVVSRYRDHMVLLENADVVLRHGSADIPALQRDMNGLVAQGSPVLDLHAVSRRVDTTLSVEHTALFVLAAAVALAGGILVAQALGRSASSIGDEALALRAMGMTRTDMGVASVLSHGVTAAVAGVATFATAVGASRWFPVGLGRRIDPDVGFHVDWAVIGPGLALTVALVLTATLLLGMRADRRSAKAGVGRSSAVAARIRRAAPVTVGLGSTMAIEPGRGRAAVAVRPALVAAAVGVLGIVATLTIDHGIRDALRHRERAGVTYQAVVRPGPDSLRPAGVDPGLAGRIQRAAGRGSALAVVDRAVTQVGGVGVPMFTVRRAGDPSGRPIRLAITTGRAPAGQGEADIGPATAADLGVKVGSTVAVGGSAAPVRIVGLALFPDDVHAQFDEGLWVVPGQFDAVWPPDTHDIGNSIERVVAVRFPSGTAGPAAVARLTGALNPDVPDVEPASVPVELTNLRSVRVLPELLAGFLALLGIAAVAHVLVTSARRRRHDFAVLRAIGLTRGGTRLVLNWQGTAVATVGLLLGVPLGVVLGRVGWRLVTERVPLLNVPPFAGEPVLVLIAATVVVVNLLALWPGRIVARRRMPAEELRAE